MNICEYFENSEISKIIYFLLFSFFVYKMVLKHDTVFFGYNIINIKYLTIISFIFKRKILNYKTKRMFFDLEKNNRLFSILYWLNFIDSNS